MKRWWWVIPKRIKAGSLESKEALLLATEKLADGQDRKHSYAANR